MVRCARRSQDSRQQLILFLSLFLTYLLSFTLLFMFPFSFLLCSVLSFFLCYCRYRAPECLLTDGFYNYKMDMWGVGCVFFEVMALFPLFPGTNELDQIQKIHNIVGTPPPELLAKIKRYHLISLPLFLPLLSSSFVYWCLLQFDLIYFYFIFILLI